MTVQQGPLTFTATWKIQGSRLIVYFRGEEEIAILGTFTSEPEALARMLLAEMVDRQSKLK